LEGENSGDLAVFFSTRRFLSAVSAFLGPPAFFSSFKVSSENPAHSSIGSQSHYYCLFFFFKTSTLNHLIPLRRHAKKAGLALQFLRVPF
jgi:hypothetical protein